MSLLSLIDGKYRNQALDLTVDSKGAHQTQLLPLQKTDCIGVEETRVMAALH
jgi:hypothetical protein